MNGAVVASCDALSNKSLAAAGGYERSTTSWKNHVPPHSWMPARSQLDGLASALAKIKVLTSNNEPTRYI